LRCLGERNGFILKGEALKPVKPGSDESETGVR